MTLPAVTSRHASLGLRGRLILLLLAAFAALTGLIVWHSLADRDEGLRDTSAHLLHSAQLIAARQQNIAEHADAILTSLMLRPDLRPGAAAGDCSRALAAVLQKETKFAQAAMTSPDGVATCAAVPPQGRVSLADRNWFQQALQSRETVVSEVLTGRILGKPVIIFAKALRDADGRVAAVFFLSLDLEWLHGQLAATRLPEGARLAVVDGRGTIAVRHPDPEGWAGRSAAHLSLFQRLIAADGEGTLEDIGLDGERKIYGFTPLLDTVSGRTYLWLSLPKAAVEAAVRRELLVNLVIALAVLVATLGLVVWGGNRLVLEPLQALSRAAARLSAGDLAARSGLPHTNDEIGRLARTLDETAAAIADREHRLDRTNRALRVLSAGNQALLRAGDEHELMEAVCRAIVEAGGYRMAWVGLADKDERVRLAASWGAETEFLDGLDISCDETAAGRGPTGTAIRQGIPVACSNVQTDPDYAPWREQAQRYGYASSLALPLRLADEVIGALNVYAAEPDAFDADAVELLGEVAGDLAYGIATQRAKRAMRDSEERFRVLAASAPDGIVLIDGAGTIVFWNAAAERLFGYTAAEALGRGLHALIVPPERREAAARGMEKFAATGEGPLIGATAELETLRKDGTIFIAEHAITALRIGGAWHAVGIVRDITQRREMQRSLERQLDELRRFQDVALSRELRMKALVEENERLKTRLDAAARERQH